MSTSESWLENAITIKRRTAYLIMSALSARTALYVLIAGNGPCSGQLFNNLKVPRPWHRTNRGLLRGPVSVSAWRNLDLSLRNRQTRNMTIHWPSHFRQFPWPGRVIWIDFISMCNGENSSSPCRRFRVQVIMNVSLSSSQMARNSEAWAMSRIKLPVRK